MALEPNGNGEICSVTGTEANARFKGNLGFAWYESRYDLCRMVDISGKYDGPVCDDVIEQAIKDGEIFIYNYVASKKVEANDLPAKAAAIVFARGAQRQVDLLANPPARTSVDVGMIFYEDAAKLNAPRWLAPMVRFTGKNSIFDFDYAGCLWSMSTLATGGVVTDEAAMKAGFDMHAFAVAALNEEAEFDAHMTKWSSEILAGTKPGETDEAQLEDAGSGVKGL